MEATRVKPKVKLVGEDGNAFVIIAFCKTAWNNAGYPKEEMDTILEEMMSGDYDNLLQTVMKYFDVI